MKKTIVFLFAMIFCATQWVQSQNLEKKLNIRAGFIGAWVSYEQPLGESIILNGELGYIGGIVGGDFLFTSIVELEPRYYYNFQKRFEKGKSTKNNSANYFGLHLSYLPDILTATKYDNLRVDKTFNIIPTYGLRRNIGGAFNFDFEVGLGYQIINGDDNQLVPSLGIGLSYSLN